MDKPLIFGYFGKIVRSKGKTKVECFWVEMIRPLKSKEVGVGKSAFMIIRTLMALCVAQVCE